MSALISPGLSKARRLLVPVTCAVLLTTCITAEEINPPTAAFVAASDKMATSLRTGPLATYRRSLRQDAFVADIYDLAQQKSLDTLPLKSRKVPVGWLCAPTYQYNVYALPLAALDARNKVLGERVKTPGDDIGPLITALGTSYAIPAEKGGGLEPSYGQWIDGKGKDCKALVDAGDPFATRQLTTNESLIASGMAAITLIETIWKVAKPVAVGTLKIVDTERRAAAIKAFFSDTDNVARMKEQFILLETFIDDEIKHEKTKAAGNAAAMALILYDPEAPHWAKIREAMSAGSCSRGEPDRGQKKTCIDSLLAAASKPLAEALDAADKFDVVLGRELPAKNERLSDQVETLRKIARGEQVTDDHLKAVWAAAMRYIALFQTIGDAASSDNQKKITDALAAFEKAIKN